MFPSVSVAYFSRDVNIFCQEVFQIVFVSRGGAFLEFYRVCNGMLTVDIIRKHLLGLTLSKILPLALISALTLRVWKEMRATLSLHVFYFARPYRCIILSTE